MTGWDLKSLHWRLLLWSNVLVATASGLFWVVVYVAPRSLSQNPTEEYPLAVAVKGNTTIEICALLALLLLIGNLLYLLYGRNPRAPVQHVVSEGPGGPFKVSREAIESGLKAAGEALDEVTRARVSLDSVGLKRVVVRVQFQSPEGVPIHTASQLLRTTLRERFAQLVQLQDAVKLHLDIEFTSFAGRISKKDAPRPEPAAEAEEERAPFTGPQYPIDDDEDPYAKN